MVLLTRPHGFTLAGSHAIVLAHAPRGFTHASSSREGFPGWDRLLGEAGLTGIVAEDELGAAVRAQREDLAVSDDREFNGPTLGVTGWAVVDGSLALTHYPSDYATLLVTRRLWRRLHPMTRAQALAHDQGPLVPLFAQGLGLATTVVTTDRRLLLARKSDQVANAGTWTFTTGETAEPGPGGGRLRRRPGQITRSLPPSTLRCAPVVAGSP